MDGTWATLLGWCVIVGIMVGVPIGWYWRGTHDRKRRRKMETERIRKRRIVEARKAEAETLRITRKQRELHDAGRKLPAREGAGPPIKVRRLNIARSPRPQK